MKIRAILETETMDPDFREPFLNGMPFDITESTSILALIIAQNPLSNENQTYNPNINCHGSSSHGIPYQ